eukprot:4025511-Amphidinium_carterae.3
MQVTRLNGLQAKLQLLMHQRVRSSSKIAHRCTGWHVLLESWLDRLPERLRDNASQVKELCSYVRSIILFKVALNSAFTDAADVNRLKLCIAAAQSLVLVRRRLVRNAQMSVVVVLSGTLAGQR